MLGAHTGEGKTTLALAIIEAVVTGGELLGFQGVGDVRALVLDAEQGVRTIKRRLQEAGLAECAELDVIRVPDRDTRDAQALWRRCREAILDLARSCPDS